MRIFLHSKIVGARLTAAHPGATCALTIDGDLLDRASIREFERVLLVDKRGGTRVETYALRGRAGTGEISLSGPPADHVQPGDLIELLTFQMSEDPAEPICVEVDDDNAFTGTGTLLFSEISWTPHGTEDLVYVNAFWAIDEYTSVARAPDAGGPLGRVGILFAAVALGRYDSPLSNQAQDVAGAAVGWQKLWDDGRKQLILEAASCPASSSAHPRDCRIG